MKMNPFNLGIRFLLEIAAMFSMAYYGWQRGTGALQYVFAISIPVVAAVIWGTFNVPKDPSRSGKTPVRIPGIFRLLLEWIFFGMAFWMLAAVGVFIPAIILGIITLLHYAFSYNRIIWLFGRW